MKTLQPFVYPLLLLVAAILVCAASTYVALAADTKPQTETEVLTAKLKAAEQDARLSKLEVLVHRERQAMQDLDKIRADEQALYVETCKAAGFGADPKTCAIDLQARTVTERKPEKPVTAAK